eukprot:TRINITY_DN6590_c0_g1_i2.p1 TRINITY_DN6590_c0_g1~~TRINITY_DN6590_c0_g1_i2.p1  ORF type:complete len:276 (-),score=66.76 TRINITY_DN6590_c0_g1_i2:51-878(-)
MNVLTRTLFRTHSVVKSALPLMKLRQSIWTRVLPALSVRSIASSSITKAREDLPAEFLQPPLLPPHELPARNMQDRMAKMMLWMTGYYSQTSTLIRKSHRIYRTVQEQANLPVFYETQGAITEKTFQAWFSVSVLHIWMVFRQLRVKGDFGQKLSQQVFERFWDDVEFQMRNSGLKLDSLINQNMKELVNIYFGTVVAYDEGFSNEDATLAGSLYRNLFGMNQATSASALDSYVKYIRRQVHHLSEQNIDYMVEGHIHWLSPPSVDTPNSSTSTQ